jgi:hypothetical protein
MRAARLTIAALFVLPIAVLAQDQPPQPQSTQEHANAKLAEGETSSSCISNFTFSQEFLAKYPNAGGACHEVKVENGQKWARFDAEVFAVNGRRVTANFVDRYDRNVGQITFEAPSNARVDVNGRRTRYSDLQRGDRLSFWVPESRAGFYAAPGTAASDKLAVIDTQPAQR